MKTIKEKMFHVYMTGGTGLITTVNGKVISILATTVTRIGKYYVAKTETGKEIKIQASEIQHAEPA